MEQVRKRFEALLQEALPGQAITLERPKSGEMGDWAFPCFRAAKGLGKNPTQVAQDLAGLIQIEGAECIAAGPYLNLKLEASMRASLLLGDILHNSSAFGQQPPTGRRIVIEYSSPNIAKLFTIGHLRSTMIGHALVQIHRYLGDEVVRINHLGDWGTQFGTLLAAYKRWAEAENPQLDRDFNWCELVEEKRRTPLYRLFQLYVRFHQEEEQDPAMRDEARNWFKRLESGDKEARKLWSWFREISLREFQRLYDRLGVGFDALHGEAFYEDQLPEVLQRLSQSGLIEEGEGGAKIVRLEDRKIQTPCLIQKADGTSIYATRDVAALLYRQSTYDFHQAIYVVGADQVLHFQQVFAVVQKLDPWFEGRLVHTPFGMIKLPEGKMSTRKGNVIFLEDVLDEAKSRVRAIIEEKNPELEDKEGVAEMLGMGAVIFFDALNDRIKSITFEWDRAIALDGDTGPYVQYAHARICSILRKAEEDWIQWAKPSAPFQGQDTAVVPFETLECSSDFHGLEAKEAQALLFELAGFPSAVRNAADQLMSTPITRQLLTIARAFSAFYTNCPVLWEDIPPGIRRSRLLLCLATARVLRQGLFLLGIQAPEEM